MSLPELLQHFAKVAEGQGERTNGMRPLLWIVSLFVTAFLVLALSGRASLWAMILTGAFSALSATVAMIVYIWFAIKKPDFLRSEKFLIRRMEIEQASIGDSNRGFVDERSLVAPAPVASSKELPQ